MDSTELNEKSKINWKLLLIIVGFVIVATGLTSSSVYYVMNQHAIKDKENAEKRAQDLQKQIDGLKKTINSTSTITPTDATASWKSVKFNDITIKYQPDWSYVYNPSFPTAASIKTDVKKFDSFNKDYQTLGISITKITYDGSGLENAVNKLATAGQPFSLANKQNITVNNVSALRYDNSGCCGSIMNRVFFIVDGSIYEVSVDAGGLLTQADLTAFNDRFNTFLQTITF